MALEEPQLTKLFGASTGLLKATARCVPGAVLRAGGTRSGEQWSRGAATESDGGRSPW